MEEGEVCEDEQSDDEVIASKLILVRLSLQKITISSAFIFFSNNYSETYSK